ncbi:hypothetical protein [Streptomyces sp. SJL17-1]|uniref:hypothetical protein n=1 Tax=Streptomyces sp. SJL17-1 TaxID=2967223 RepID=UPI002966249F|nr:hypothetical protein [Streptomyces sp. SJL17-1]
MTTFTEPTSVLDGLSEPPPAPLPGLDVLRALVADAALRAAALLDGPEGALADGAAAPSGAAADGVDDVTADIVRFVAQNGDSHLERAAHHLGVPPGRLRLLATAHRWGGRPAVATCLAPLPADPEVLAAAEHAVQSLRPSPTAPVERHHNHLTDAPARVQLRYGPDRRWHPYVERYGGWQPAAAPHPDAATAYRAARTALRAATRT